MLGHNGIDDLGRTGRVAFALAVGSGDLGDDHDFAVGGRKRRRKLRRKGSLSRKAEHVLVKGEWRKRGRHGYNAVKPLQALMQKTRGIFTEYFKDTFIWRVLVDIRKF